MLKILSDEQRPGTPCKFTPEQICQIINVSCEQPDDLGLPLSHWSLSSLADELVRRNIVNSISTSQLSVSLKSSTNKTHKVKKWIHTPIEDEEKFNKVVETLYNFYRSHSEDALADLQGRLKELTSKLNITRKPGTRTWEIKH